MKDKRYQISPYQAYACLVCTMLGVSFLSLPRLMAKRVGTDGVYTLLISALIAWGLIYVLSKLSIRFPRQSLLDYVPALVSSQSWVRKAIQCVLVACFGCIWLYIASYVIRELGEVVTTIMLPNVPLEPIMISFLLVAAIAANLDVRSLAMLNELIFPLVGFLFLLLFIGLASADEMNFLPLFQVNWSSVWMGVVAILVFYSGLNLFLFFSEYYEKPEKSHKVHTSALGTVSLLHWMAYMAVIGTFGVAETKQLLWPVNTMIEKLTFPDLLLRYPFMALWMCFVFAALVNMLFTLTNMIKKSFHVTDRVIAKMIPYGIVLVLYILASYTKSISDIGRNLIYFATANWVVTLSVAGVAFLLVGWRKTKNT